MKAKYKTWWNLCILLYWALGLFRFLPPSRR